MDNYFYVGITEPLSSAVCSYRQGKENLSFVYTGNNVLTLRSLIKFEQKM